jgi:hypothetical protein
MKDGFFWMNMKTLSPLRCMDRMDGLPLRFYAGTHLSHSLTSSKA